MLRLKNKIINGEESGDSFGHSVSVSSDGSIIAISAPNNEGELTKVSGTIGNEYSFTITNETAIYYQTNGNSGWSFAPPTPTDFKPAHKKVGINPGSVKVFQNKNGEWVQLGNEILGDSLMDQIGVSLSLSADGQTLAVGSPLSITHKNNNYDYSSPFVAVYKLRNGEWLQIGKTSFLIILMNLIILAIRQVYLPMEIYWRLVDVTEWELKVIKAL